MAGRTAATVLVGLILLCAVGCSSGPRPEALDSGRSYPTTKSQSRVLNIQLIRDQAELTLTNTTARAFGPTVIWLNQEFWYEISGLEVGDSVQLPLGDFRNEFGKRFRAGGFFATERPKNVVLAQLETEDSDSLLGLIVVDGVARR
jgi:hypothetical protein